MQKLPPSEPANASLRHLTRDATIEAAGPKLVFQAVNNVAFGFARLRQRDLSISTGHARPTRNRAKRFRRVGHIVGP